MKSNGNTLLVRPVRSIALRDPWAEMAQFSRNMDALFGQTFPPAARPALESQRGELGLSPDIYETEEGFVYVLALPGVNPDAIQVEATHETLTLRGERKPFYANENAKILRQGGALSQGTFEATYTLPTEVDAKRIQANYRNGVLEIHLPKAEAVRPQPVKISIEGQSQS